MALAKDQVNIFDEIQLKTELAQILTSYLFECTNINGSIREDTLSGTLIMLDEKLVEIDELTEKLYSLLKSG